MGVPNFEGHTAIPMEISDGCEGEGKILDNVLALMFGARLAYQSAGLQPQTLEHWQFLNWAISNCTSSPKKICVFDPSILENMGKPWIHPYPSISIQSFHIFPNFPQSFPIFTSGREISDAWLEELRSPAGADRAPHARVEKEPIGRFRKLREWKPGDFTKISLKAGCFTYTKWRSDWIKFLGPFGTSVAYFWVRCIVVGPKSSNFTRKLTCIG